MHFKNGYFMNLYWSKSNRPESYLQKYSHILMISAFHELQIFVIRPCLQTKKRFAHATPQPNLLFCLVDSFPILHKS